MYRQTSLLPFRRPALHPSLPRSRRVLLPLAALSLVLTACGGDDDASTTAASADASSTASVESTTTAATTTAASTTATPAPTEAPAPSEAPAATDTAAPAVTDAPAAGAVVPVSLIEWEIVAQTEIPAGTVTFEATNDGEFPHELAIVRGDSYDTLPHTASGAVDEDALADGDLIGRIDRFEPGLTQSATFELEPGNYVLMCNIAVGPNSHAAQGQVLSVTVVEG